MPFEDGNVRLLIDRNDDGDFADTHENETFGPVATVTERLGVTFNSLGRALVAGHQPASVYVDPF